MRYDPEHKQRTRARVLQEASRSLRMNGPDKLGVADVMRNAGLTHGGFYAHFASKDELVSQAIEEMFLESLARFETVTSGKSAADGLTAYIERYLSGTHRDARDRGCPLAAMSTDIPRLHQEARNGFERGAAQLASAIAVKLRELGHAAPGELAISVLSELVGAMVMARSITDAARSAAVLEASRSQLLARLGFRTHGAT
jgi:TetR/AcrR family transcriptional repressor of nem operon